MALIRYTKSTLVPGEKIVYAGRLHRFSFISGTLTILLGIVMLSNQSAGQLAPGEEASSSSVALQWLNYFVQTAQYYFARAIQEIPEDMQPFFGWALDARSKMVGLIVLCVGFYNMVNTIVRRLSVEMAVTNKKIIYKKGLVKVDETEIPLNHIEGVKVKQTAFDRMINRGNLLVTGIGMEQIEMKRVADPARFRNEAYGAIDTNR